MNERLRQEVTRLRQDLGRQLQPGEPCPRNCIGLILTYCPEKGQQVPTYSEADVTPCETCGGRHVLLIEEVIVRTREEADTVLARNAVEGAPP
jgi:hypothetical protein